VTALLFATIIGSVGVWALHRRRFVHAGLEIYLVGHVALRVASIAMHHVLEQGGQTSDYQFYDRIGADFAAAGGILGGADPRTDFPGIQTIEILTGTLYGITGQSRLVADLFFTLLGFAGTLFLVAAIRALEPAYSTALAVKLALISPTIAYFTSVLSKDAVIFLGLSMAMYGVARAGQGRPHFLVLGGGLAVISTIRPHIAALFGVAYLLSSLLGARANAGKARGLRLASAAVLVVVLVVGAVPFLQTWFVRGAEDDLLNSAIGRFDEAAAGGGSTYRLGGGNPIVSLVLGTLALPLRPLPMEIRGVTGAFAGLEAYLLAAIAVHQRRSLKAIIRSVGRARDGLLSWAVVYSVLFCIAFSSLANVGTLVRQRAQLMVSVLVLIGVRAADVDEARPASPAPAQRGSTAVRRLAPSLRGLAGEMAMDKGRRT
jgi:hypothetical protein